MCGKRISDHMFLQCFKSTFDLSNAELQNNIQVFFSTHEQINNNNNNNNNLIYIAPACRMTSEALQKVLTEIFCTQLHSSH